MKKSCLFCNKDFYKKPSHSMAAWIQRTKFCSRSCVYAFRLGKPTWNKGKRIPFKARKPHTPEAKLKMSESHKNISEETRNRMVMSHTGKVGPLSSNWRGGVTPIYASIRNHFKMRQWRSDVFTRDNFTCLECGDSRGGNLNADHIIPFVAILKAYDINNLQQALECQKLWDINNGRTLCSSCHRKTETWGENAKKYIYAIS